MEKENGIRCQFSVEYVKQMGTDGDVRALISFGELSLDAPAPGVASVAEAMTWLGLTKGRMVIEAHLIAK